MLNQRFYSLICILIFSVISTLQVTAQDLTEPPTSANRAEFVNYVKQNAPSEDAFVAVQRLASESINNKQWEEAATIFETYRSLFPEMDTRFHKIIELLRAEEENLLIKKLGSGINTEYSDTGPIPTADGTKMYFSARGRPDAIGGRDIYVSKLINGIWLPAENLGSEINSTSHEIINSISADENIMILFGHYPQTLGGGDNFFCERIEQGWGKIQHFPSPINSKHMDFDAMITSDGQALIFTSERPGNIGEFHEKGNEFHCDYWGNIDIYVCTKIEKGWCDPINLGPKINTPYSDRSPFLHPDGKTLYFCSDGHYGLGNHDVFKATRLNDSSWTDWSDPVNLGKKINSAIDELDYKVSTSGDIAYFAKYNSLTKADIYLVELPKVAQAEAVVTIKGTVLDESNNPLPANIKWENLTTGKIVGELKTDPNNGSYFIVLPLGRNYGYYASLEGYYPVSENIDLQDSTKALDLTNDIRLISIKEMQDKELVIEINNVFFDHDQYELKEESHAELNRLAEVLKDNSDLQVEIAGHTDNVGAPEYNQRLSEKRARAVVDYLVNKNCNLETLIVKGYGESKPIASNDTERGRAENRRVEFRFVKDLAVK